MKRRDFVKGCTAAALFLLPGVTNVAKAAGANRAPTSGADKHVEKAIKASFGGGFSVRAHNQSQGLTYAEIEHFNNRYVVASADLVDWKIVRSSLDDRSLAKRPSVQLPTAEFSKSARLGPRRTRNNNLQGA